MDHRSLSLHVTKTGDLSLLSPSGAANMLAGQKKNLIAVAKNWYHQFSIHTLSLIQGNKSVCGFHLGYLDGETELITQVMNTILDLYKQGKVKPHIDSTWHLEQVGDVAFTLGVDLYHNNKKCS